LLPDCGKPVDRLRQSSRKRRLALKPKAFLRPAHIELASRLAVGFARVPHNAPVEAGQPGDGLEQGFAATWFPSSLPTGGVELAQFFRARHAADRFMHGFEHANILDLRDLRQQPQPFQPKAQLQP